MSILWLIIKVTLFILLGIVLMSVFILFLVLMAPIKYDFLYEKYEDTYCHLGFSFLKFIKANLIFEKGKQDNQIKVFGKVIYHYHTDDFEEVVEDTVRDTVQNTEVAAKGVITEESHQRGEDKTGTTKWRVLKDLLWDEQFFALLKDILVACKRILKWLKPSELNFDLLIGKENPADTGQLIAQITLLYPWYYQYGIVEGSYDEEGIWGNIYAKGKFHLIGLVKIIILFIRKKETRDYIRLLFKTRKGV